MITLNCHALKVARVAAKDDTRPVLTCLYLANGEAFSSDGFILMRCKTPMGADETPLLIPAKDILAVKWTGDVSVVRQPDGSVLLSDGVKSRKVKPLEGTVYYPAFDPLYPRTVRQAYFCMSKRYLSKILSATHSYVRIRIYGDHHPIEFSLDEEDIAGLVMPLWKPESDTTWLGGPK